FVTPSARKPARPTPNADLLLAPSPAALAPPRPIDPANPSRRRRRVPAHARGATEPGTPTRLRRRKRRQMRSRMTADDFSLSEAWHRPKTRPGHARPIPETE